MAESRKTGYGLHLQRVIFSGGSIMRSIKFPLIAINESSDLSKKKFENDIIADDLKVRGSINLPDYQRIPNTYTLADFWLDSLRAGVIWQPTAKKLDYFIKRFFKQPSLAQEIFDKAATKNRKLRFFEKDIFVENFILADPKRKTGSAGGFRNTLVAAVKSEYKKDQELKYRELQQLIDNVVKDFYNKTGQLRLSGGDVQDRYWFEEFSIDKSLLKQSKSTDKTLAKLTFFIIPNLIALEGKLTAHELIERRKRLFCNPKADFYIEGGKLVNLLGLENNFNALSHYLNYAFQFLYSAQIDEIFGAFEERVPTISRRRKKIKIALKFLFHRAKKLGYPCVGEGWHQYRSNFGGKIQSWFKNNQRRDKEFKDQLEKLKEGIKNAQTLIEGSLKDNPAVCQEVDSLNYFLERISQVLETDLKSLQVSDNYEVFLGLLSLARRDLNIFYQKYIREEGDDTPVHEHKVLKGFYSKLYKPMAFFAQRRLEENDKMINRTVAIIEEGVQIVYKFLETNKVGFDPESVFDQVKRKNESAESVYRFALQRVWDNLKEKRVNSAEFKDEYTRILKKNSKDEIQWKRIYTNPDKYTFYRSPYSKGTSEEIKLDSENFLLDFKTLVEDLYGFAASLKNTSIFSDKDLLLDRIELLKTVLSYLVRFNKNEEFSIKKLNLKNFEKANRYLKLFKLKKFSKKDAAYVYQSLIFSELRGAATVFSKEIYTSRYVLQIEKSTDKFPLFFFSKVKLLDARDLSSNRKGNLLSQKPHYYCVSVNKKTKMNKKVQPSKYLHLEKKKMKTVGLAETDSQFLLKISTSPYQLQFLERFVSPTKDWRNVSISLGEWSFVVERDSKIDWGKKRKKPVFHRRGDMRLYLSLPFQISAKTQTKRRGLNKLLSDRVNHPILGVDVGEYGVGWVLVRFTKDSATILRKGFINDKNIAAIQNSFATIQQRAKKGIFNVPSTTVAEVRKNAIGSVRNQIHDILTKESAGVVYEYSISNFETGSGRVTKVYNSVKRSDVYPETEADKQQHTHVWGEKYKTPGTHLSAYASSYICVACARSIYEFNQDDVGKAKVIAREGNILTIHTSKGNVCGYSQNRDVKKNYNFKGTKEGVKEFMKLVKDFARPPVVSKKHSRSETLQKFIPQVPQRKLNQFAKERGNSAVFVCPFVGCHNVADADIQAAFMMAMRGYFNLFRSPKVKLALQGSKYLEKTLNFLTFIEDRKKFARNFYAFAHES